MKVEPFDPALPVARISLEFGVAIGPYSVIADEGVIALKRPNFALILTTLSLAILGTGCDKSSTEKKPATPPNLAEIPKSDSNQPAATKTAEAPKAETPPKPVEPAKPAPSNAQPDPAAASGAAKSTGAADPHAGMVKTPGASGDPHAGMSTRSAQPGAQAEVSGNAVTLIGIAMTVPEGWIHEPTPSGPMAAAAVFKLPRAEGDSDDGSVRVTHFPGMKGMDDQNIERWLGQTTRSDGKPATRADAKLGSVDLGEIKLVSVDVSGNVKATMRSEPISDGRMIAVIVDHPKGPHFVVATGPAATIKKWQDSINSFLMSTKVR